MTFGEDLVYGFCTNDEKQANPPSKDWIWKLFFFLEHLKLLKVITSNFVSNFLVTRHTDYKSMTSIAPPSGQL